MIRHFFVTSLIVAVIYLAALWPNLERIPKRVAWSDYVSYMSSVDPDWTGRTGAALGELHKDTSGSILGTTEGNTLANNSENANVALVEANSTPVFPATRIVGVKASIDLSDVSQMSVDIDALWQEFSDHIQLHKAVSWVDGVNTCYAYYYDFNSDYTQAKLIIGYASDSQIAGLANATTKSGPYTPYALTSSGRLPDEAWGNVYPDGVVLERYEVSDTGDIYSGNAITI